MFTVKEAIAIGQWQPIGKPFYKSLPAHAVLGKLKSRDKSKILAVFYERTGQVAHPPKLEDLIPFMWLKGFSLPAINRAIAYVHSTNETIAANKSQKRAA